jgi:hypothetical protein
MFASTGNVIQYFDEATQGFGSPLQAKYAAKRDCAIKNSKGLRKRIKNGIAFPMVYSRIICIYTTWARIVQR